MEAILHFTTVTTGFITDGPKCYCGKCDWFVGSEIVRCSHCDRTRDAILQGYFLNGPKCYCGKRDWFVGSSVYRCSHCDRTREK